jgi:hypothetical protein
MKNANYDIVKSLMNKDGSLDDQIYNLQCELKRDTTIEEENAIVQKMLDECMEVCRDLSCSITEAYDDIMH